MPAAANAAATNQDAHRAQAAEHLAIAHESARVAFARLGQAVRALDAAGDHGAARVAEDTYYDLAKMVDDIGELAQ